MLNKNLEESDYLVKVLLNLGLIMISLNRATLAILTLVGLASTVSTSFILASDVSNVEFRQISPDQPNEVVFEPQSAKALRLSIFSSQNNSPAIDELLVFGPTDESDNLARRKDVKVGATSCIEGYAIHRIENLVDGKFGNDHSWVAANNPTFDAPQAITLDWTEPIEISKVVFSRDRLRQYADRVPTSLEIAVSLDGENWTTVANIRGTSADAGSGLTIYGSHWTESPAAGAVKDVAFITDAKLKSTNDEYEQALRDAFLGEENALLKIAGFADCERWLLQRHYPEYVEPEHKPESIVPLPSLSNPPDFDDANSLNDEFWQRASAATERVFAPNNFSAGPLVEQTVRAALSEDALYLKIAANRFLSEHIAMVSAENVPTRGFIVLRDGKLFWRQIDPLDGRNPWDELELAGRFDQENGSLGVRIPLNLIPTWKERGLYVCVGIGGLHVLPGGRPVHFQPAGWSVSIQSCDRKTATFQVLVEATGSQEIKLTGAIAADLAPGVPQVLPVKGEFGQVGPEVVCSINENEGVSAQLVGLCYDPCYRPFCQLKDMLERAEAIDMDNLEVRDFQKRTSIPGVANPRYVDVDQVVGSLNLEDERSSLCSYFDELDKNGYQSDVEEIQKIKEQALTLWKEYQNRADTFEGERDLFLRVRTLKRNFFLADDELEPAEHILANKRNPFWPSHNYSDLFDSTWTPGGAVVLIDVPRVNGRLAPEQALTKELVQAGDGIIRNPSASFDATKLYYAYRESQNEYYRIWELDLNDGNRRRISPDGPFHDFWPTELPDGDLAFVSTRCKKKFICWRPQAFVLHRMNKSGGDLRELSFANLTEFAPSIADDGRIIWTRSEYVDKGADYGHTLWTIRDDGTSPELVFGNTINLPQGYANGRFVPDAADVSCVLISHFGDLNGPVALLDTSKGPHDPSAIRSITPEVPWPGFWAKTETFREPVPISRNVLLVAHAAFDRFGIYLIDRFGNRELLTIDPAIDTICPQPFAPRERPPVAQSLPDPELKQMNMGRFSVANVYRGLEGQVEFGAAKYLRVCQEMPTPLQQLDDGTYRADHEPFMEFYASPVDVLQGAYGWSSYVAKGVLGTVEIADDGSVDFLAPSGKVLFFQLLDENYNEIQRMRSVVQLQAGEKRSCIGCHENRLSAPEGGLTSASGRPTQTLVPPPWGAGPFWYEKTVQPILDRKCVECHDSETAEKNQRQFDLTGTRDENKIPASYKSLIQSGDVHYFDYTWGAGKTTKANPYTFGTSQSALWKILKDDRHRSVSLTSEEEQALKCWTDLNVPLWGDYQQRSSRD
ncbi:MAG: discoidin domain-containing protein [Thermoguttaceae bacterium]|nr:discoidin domain-containing protein [Thermoguttaceae bacterium]